MDSQVRSAVGDGAFSATWEGKLRPAFTGEYQLGLAHQECDSCPGTITEKLTIDGKVAVSQTRKAATGAGANTSKIKLKAGRDYALRVEYSQAAGGSGVELVWTPPAQPLIAEAAKLAAKCDTVILCLGLNSRLEGEELKMKIPGFSGGDRTSLDLPAIQNDLLKALVAKRKPIVVVLLNGSALSINFAADKADAILEAWYPGQEGGAAIARTLAGDNNPAGRLPITFYRSVDQLPAFTDYSMKGRTYRYFDGDPLFRFGYGLSYSSFDYKGVPRQTINATQVTNTSNGDGDEVVQKYIPGARDHWQLAGFQRIHLRAGESRIVSFTGEKSAHWKIAGSSPATTEAGRNK